MNKFSHLAETLPGSQILAISQAIKERIKNGETIYNLTVGDFDSSIFPIPPKLEGEIIRAYLQRFTTYPAAEGDPELRNSISKFVSTFGGLNYSTDEILCGSGGRPLIYALYRTLVDPGDRVVYPVPSWNNHYYTQMVGGIPVEIETNKKTQFMPTATAIKPHLKGTVLLCLCSPQNPTGTCFTKEGLAEICELIVNENKRRGEGEKKLYLLYDQMYWLLTHGTTQHYNPVSVCPSIRPYVISIDAISKSFAATGVRVGWALGPQVILNKMKAILSHVGAWAPMAEQKAVANFLQEEESVRNYQRNILGKINIRLEKIYRYFLRLKTEGYPVDVIPPQGGIYLTIKIDFPQGHELLLNEAGIGVLPFFVFGSSKDSRWCRISVGTCKEEEIGPMMQKLKRALRLVDDQIAK